REYHALASKDQLTEEEKQILIADLGLYFPQLHNKFWDLDVASCAVAVNYLMIGKQSYENEASLKKAYEAALETVLTRLFPNRKTDEQEDLFASFLTSYLAVSDQYQRPYLMAALLVSSKQLSGENVSVGQRFASICEHLGPAYVKLAQAV